MDLNFLGDIARPRLEGVPEHLIRHTAGKKSFDEFQLSATEVIAMFEAATIKHTGKRMHEFTSILDFGCGAGRLMQFLPVNLRLAGCDVNEPLVDFMKINFPHADIYRNSPSPPLQWSNSSFDLIYGFSVFSHLKQESEDLWLTELERVGRPDCLYLITVQGDWWIESKFKKPQQDALRQAGFWYFDIHTPRGDVMDFPDNYGSSIHTSDYIKESWGKKFEILQVYKGKGPMLFDDPKLSASHRAALKSARSMGQDLVVMKKRS